MNVYSNRDGPGLKVNLRLSWDCLSGYEIEKEFKDTSETCFVHLASQFAIGKLSLDEYLDGVLSHLKHGGPKHKWDVPSEKITNFMELDIFAGAVKRWATEPEFVPLEDQDFSKLKTLATISWTADDPIEFDRRCQESQIDMTTLSPEIADIHLVIHYCKRHTRVFKHLIRMFSTPPQKTSFDVMDSIALTPRTDPNTIIFQHSPKARSNGADDISMWTEILNSDWLHDPVDGEKMQWLMVGIRVTGMNVEPDKSVAFGSPKLNAYFAALESRGMRFTIGDVGAFLMDCDSVEQARDYLASYKSPLPDGEVGRWDSESLIGRISILQCSNEEFRVEIMKLALQRFPGVNINAAYNSNPWEDDMPGHPRTPQMTGLQHAAAKGNKAMAELLLQHGARTDAREIVTGQTAADFARKAGHTELADMLERPAV